jgi:hypothetical protein
MSGASEWMTEQYFSSNRPPDLGGIDAGAADPIVEMNRGVSSGLSFPSDARHLDAERAERHLHFPKNHDHIRPGAGCRGQQERDHGAGSGGVVSIDQDGGSIRLPATEGETLLPGEGDLLGFSPHELGSQSLLGPGSNPVVIPDGDHGDEGCRPRDRSEVG